MKITKEEIIRIERAARRRIEIERNSPHFKGGIHKDRKKEKNRNKCRRKNYQEGWE